MEKRFVGVDELASYLDISADTIRYWVWQKQIPHFKFGRRVKFSLTEIESWLSERRVEEIS